MSKTETEKLLQLRLPNTHKQLHTCLGLANYFRTHSKNHAMLVQPLHQLLTQKNLQWTPENRKQFEEVKRQIENLPKLFFPDESPIYLHTDASSVGIGGYLFQLRNNIEVPIAFTSKALTTQQQKWATQEIECYAIFISLQKFEYILRDVKFIIRTDHAALTYLNANVREKVQRWKLFIQAFDFRIEFIAGKESIVADAMSRLCSSSEGSPRIPTKYFKIISKVHNSVVGHHGKQNTIQ